MGTDADALESGTFKAAILDEWGQDKVPVESFEAVQRRLAVAQARVIIGTTPYNMGWLRQQVHDRCGRDPLYEEVNFRSIDNPAYPADEYHRLKAIWPEWKSAMMLDGIFTRPAGLIYEDYEDSYAELPLSSATSSNNRGRASGRVGVTWCDRFTIPAEWLRRVGVDFGASLHNAQLWAARDPLTDCWYLYREVAQVSATGPEQARTAAEYASRWSWRQGAQGRRTMPGWSGQRRGSQSYARRSRRLSQALTAPLVCFGSTGCLSSTR